MHSDMIHIQVKDRQGVVQTLEVPLDADYNMMEILRAYGYPMRATCGGMGLCADCLCEVLDGAGQLPQRTDQELETLDMLPELTDTNRLCCQIRPGVYLEGVYLELAGVDH